MAIRKNTGAFWVLIWKDLQDTLNEKITKTRRRIVYCMLPFVWGKGKRKLAFFFVSGSASLREYKRKRGTEGGKKKGGFPCTTF